MKSDNVSARTVQIDSDHAGQRIDNYLLKVLKGVPRSHVYRLLRSGQVRVNSGRKKPLYQLKTGDMVRIPPVRTSQKEIPTIPDRVLQILKAATLLENEELIVLNKPSGLAVHSGSGLAFGIIEAMKSTRAEQFLELVHRLDRETSGCLLLAKTRNMLTQLHELLRNENASGLGKYYLALVAGHWPGANTIDQPLAKKLRSGEHMVEVNENGQSAVSHFECLQSFENASLMRVKIDTGRTHQIRVHAAHAGHPLAGDTKYGDKTFNRNLKQLGLKRLFLHAERIEIPLEQNINVTAPLDDELQQLLDKLT